MATALDRFDRVQLQDVLAGVSSGGSPSAAGRVLFDRSRERKRSQRAGRPRNYLARFELEWSDLKDRLPRT